MPKTLDEQLTELRRVKQWLDKLNEKYKERESALKAAWLEAKESGLEVPPWFDVADTQSIEISDKDTFIQKACQLQPELIKTEIDMSMIRSAFKTYRDKGIQTIKPDLCAMIDKHEWNQVIKWRKGILDKE